VSGAANLGPMASRTILHVGTMKSGTSHLQSRLFENKAALADAGVCVPGQKWGDQVQGVKDILAIQRHGAERETGAWARLVEEMAAHDGPAVISMEFLGPAGPKIIQGICDAVENAECVITVRDLNRSLAAMWQETIQNGRTWTWDEYLAAAEKWRPRPGGSMKGAPKAGRTFWRQQNVVRMATDWRAAAPVTLITLPHPGAPRTLLWERFCQVLGIQPEGWADARASNESIGAASALVLRQMNELLDEAGLVFPAGDTVRKQYLAKTVLAGRKKEEPAIGLPVPGWLRQQSTLMVEQLQELDLTFIGDWGDLDPVDVPGIDPADVSAREVIDAAVVGLAALVQRDVRRS
jgi:hypothetical protein